LIFEPSYLRTEVGNVIVYGFGQLVRTCAVVQYICTAAILYIRQMTDLQNGVFFNVALDVRFSILLTPV